jgi:UDP-N-acetyl-D-mannosaminuronic acid dehydrogenase
MSTKKVCVIGLGYIGLPTAALLANRNYDVHGVDVVQDVVDTINRGEIHIVEPELDTFVRAAINSGKLKADVKPTDADIFIIAVPTPFYDGYVPNIDYIISATKSIAPYVKPSNAIILESTSPVGTTIKMQDVLQECGIDTSTLHIAHCPERVLPGHIMRELVENDRIVGGVTKEATRFVADFYREFVQGEVLETDANTAEMAKLTENSFRDVNIAFANELSIICEKFDINVWELIRLANRHPRVNILQPGVGVGGHCIAVDPWFIVHSSKDEANLIRKAREVNLHKSKWVVDSIKERVKIFEKEHNKAPKVACMGLAFKPDIDDLRESPALDIVLELSKENIDILAVEPNIKSHKLLHIVDYKEAIKEADIVVFLVAHSEFKTLKVDNSLDFCGVSQ